MSCQFSPLMSFAIADPGQVSSDGMTRPTPLPLRVGAKHKICSGSEGRMRERRVRATTPRQMDVAHWSLPCKLFDDEGTVGSSDCRT